MCTLTDSLILALGVVKGGDRKNLMVKAVLNFS